MNPDQIAGMKEKKKKKIYALYPSENTLVCSTVAAMWHKDKWHEVCGGNKYLSPRLISTALKSMNIFKEKNLPQDLK